MTEPTKMTVEERAYNMIEFCKLGVGLRVDLLRKCIISELQSAEKRGRENRAEADKCAFCGKERDGKWALLYGPPVFFDGIEYQRKSHVCPSCYKGFNDM